MLDVEDDGRTVRWQELELKTGGHKRSSCSRGKKGISFPFFLTYFQIKTVNSSLESSFEVRQKLDPRLFSD